MALKLNDDELVALGLAQGGLSTLPLGSRVVVAQVLLDWAREAFSDDFTLDDWERYQDALAEAHDSILDED